ncbi:MAG: glycosyltransferase [Pacificimonas sp.]
MRRDRILFVINSLVGGGAERVFTTILKASADRMTGADVVVAILDEAEEAYTLPKGVDVRRLGGGGGLVTSVRGLDKLVAGIRPDLIVSFLTRANVAAVIAGRRHGSRVVISERVNTTAHLDGGRFSAVSKAMVRAAYPRADQIITVSDGVAQTLADDFGVSPEKMISSPTPVDADAIEAAAAAEPEIAVDGGDLVAMGRLVPNKDFALAISAFAQSSWPGRLIIMGEGPERDALVTLARELGIADRVKLPGFVANPYAVIARAGAFVLSSRAEGFSNALVEAMATQTAVIATDCPSGPALIMEKDAALDPGTPLRATGGYLVAMGDVPAMAAAIDFMRDAEVRAAAAAAGRARIAAFGVKPAADAYWRVFDNVLAERHDERRRP